MAARHTEAPGRRAIRRPDPVAFIRDNTRLRPVPSIPEIVLHTAHEATGLWRLLDGEPDPQPPYWAFPWAGGLALARHVLDRPETVAGRRVLDIGAGGGVVAIAAAMAGAEIVLAADVDPFAIAALALNAAANGVTLDAVAGDLTPGPPPAVDIVLVGDLFYDRTAAKRVTAFLDRCLATGIAVLIGDPRRRYLPEGRLALFAEYPVPDVGDVEGEAKKPAAVFALRPA